MMNENNPMRHFSFLHVTLSQFNFLHILIGLLGSIQVRFMERYVGFKIVLPYLFEYNAHP